MFLDAFECSASTQSNGTAITLYSFKKNKFCFYWDDFKVQLIIVKLNRGV